MGHCGTTIIEANGGGHRLWYVRLLVSRWLETREGSPIRLITARNVVESVEFQTHVADLSALDVIPLDFSVFWRRRWLGRKVVPPSGRLVIPDGDRWLPTLTAQPLHTPTSVLLLRPPGVAEPRSPFRQKAKEVAARLVKQRRDLAVFNLAMFEADDESDTFVPDPIEISWPGDRRQSREALGIPQSVSMSLLIGAIEDRKGVAEVIEAWKAVRTSSARLAIVGQVEGSVAGRLWDLARRDSRVTLVSEYISSIQFDRWLAAADRVIALYHNEGSSGVALKSWALGIPVIVFSGSYLHRALVSLGAEVIPVSAVNVEHDLSVELALAPPGKRGPRLDSEALRRRTQAFADALLVGHSSNRTNPRGPHTDGNP